MAKQHLLSDQKNCKLKKNTAKQSYIKICVCAPVSYVLLLWKADGKAATRTNCRTGIGCHTEAPKIQLSSNGLNWHEKRDTVESATIPIISLMYICISFVDITELPGQKNKKNKSKSLLKSYLTEKLVTQEIWQ